LPESDVVVNFDKITDPFLDKQKNFSYKLPFYIATQYWGGSLRWHKRMREVKEREIYVFHNWKKLVPKDLFFEKNPQYFALVDGERNAHQLCTSNKEVIEIVSQKCIDFFKKNPSVYAYSLSPNDMYGFCGCAKCRALDKESGSITDRLMVFFNEVAKRVTAVYPDKKLAFYAYLNYTNPPTTVKPNPALIPVVCRTPWEFCHNHSLIEKKCVCNKRFRSILEKWTKLCPEVYVREYYGHFLWFGFWPILHTLQEDFKYYKKIGIKGVISESHEHWAVNSWVLYGAGCYLAGETDPWRKIVDRFCAGVFPNTSNLIEKIIFMLEDKTESVPCKRMDLVFDKKFLSKIKHLLNEAHKKNVTVTEEKYIGLLDYGVELTKSLIKLANLRSQGDIEEMSTEIDNIFLLIAEMQNDTILPAVKYKLAKRALDRFRKMYQNEKDVFINYFDTEFGIKLERANKGYMLRNWLMSKSYPNKIKDIDYIPMVSPILDDTLVVGLDQTLPENTKWKKIYYSSSYYSLYEYFPFRPDSVRFYRTGFSVAGESVLVVSVRAVDGYKISVDHKVLGINRKRRFSKDRLFDYYDVRLSVGKHCFELLLEGSQYLEKDDFTVLLFDKRGNPAKIVE